MELSPYVDAIREDLAVAAEAGGPDARALAERLVAPLDSAVRLALLDALTAAAAEITRDLAPGSVDVRLRGREPSFVVTPSPVAAAPTEGASLRASPDIEDGPMTRINLRLTEDLKGRVEEAAKQAGVSVNTWLIRSAATALDQSGGSVSRGAASGSDRFSGWVR